MEVVTKMGFEAATKLQVMMVKGINNAYSNVLTSWEDLADQMEREDQNIELMKRVLRNPPELRFCTPECTRHYSSPSHTPQHVDQNGAG